MEKTDKTLRNTNLSIDKENLIIIYLTIDFGPHPGILQRDLELKKSFSSLSREEVEWNILLSADVITSP